MSSESLVGGKYRLGRKIGSGSYGSVYAAADVTSGEDVAVKIESHKALHQQLLFEYKLYKNVIRDGAGIPRVRWFGQVEGRNALVMDLLGPSLEDLFRYCYRKFTLKTVLMLADQMISRIEFVHGRNFVHRDLKPDNFLMGLGRRKHRLFLVDFGLSKRFRDDRFSGHIGYHTGKSMVGTARYASVSAHRGIELSRRDDAESIGYVLAYFLRGSLPWQGLRGMTEAQRHERICEIKMGTKVEELCIGFPAEFAEYINYCRSLHFEESPDYTYMRQIFRAVARSLKYDYDWDFDWFQPRRPISAAESNEPAVEAEAAIPSPD